MKGVTSFLKPGAFLEYINSLELSLAELAYNYLARRMSRPVPLQNGPQKVYPQ
jgi:hypothetical protein